MEQKNSEFRHPPKKKRGRPSKSSTLQDTEISGMETSNSYESLTDESIEYHIAKESLKRKTPNKVNLKEPKLPPITVFNIPIATVKHDLTTIGIKDHEIKITQYGTKIFPKTNVDFKRIKNHFITNKKEFYTHTLREEQTNKFVIHGLHDIDVSEICNELNLKNINPSEIKKLYIKKPKQDTQILYLVYFKKSQLTKISDLRDIRTISYIRIRWEYYQSKRNGPIQCNNCMYFGHGALNCHLKPRCVRCGEEHVSKECPLLMNATTVDNKITEDLLKCANCGGNHSAKFVQCPKRVEFINVTKNIRSRNNKNTNNAPDQRRHFEDAPQLLNSNFPTIIPGSSKPWRQTTNSSTKNTQGNHSRTYGNISSDNDLFSTSELMGIIKEMLTKLSSCRSKSDQFHAIAELACLHLYGK